MIEIFFHVCDLPGWQSALAHAVSRMQQSGVWQNAQCVHLQTHYNQQMHNQLPENLQHHNLQVEYSEHSEPPLGEVYSICELSEWAQKQTQSKWVLRYHLKGITKMNTDAEPVALRWRDYFDHWCLDHWRLCVQALEHGYHTVGANWHENPGVENVWGHWSGNIWWARSDFLAELPMLKLPHTLDNRSQLGGFSPRHDAELWIGSRTRPPRVLELHHHEHGCVYNVDAPENYYQDFEHEKN